MVSCCVFGCTNYSQKTSEKNISYHRIPKEKVLRQAWKDKIRRANLPSLDNCHVCSEHFTADCFEPNLKALLLSQKTTRRLKRDAVPTVFSYGPQTKEQRPFSEKRAKRRQHAELLEAVLQDPQGSSCVSHSCTFTTTSSSDISSLPFDENVEMHSEDSVNTRGKETVIPVCNKEIPTSKDIGLQCFIGAKYSITKTVETQTMPPPSVSDRSVQVGHSKKSPKKEKQASEQRPTMFEKLYPSDTSDTDPFSSPMASCGNDDYLFTDGSESSVSSNTESEFEVEAHEDQKYLVFRSCLTSLFKYCQSCGGLVSNFQESTSGSLLSVKLFCINGHESFWNSQPFINRVPAGNLLMSAAILFSGNTFSRVSQLASFLNLKLYSHTTYYNIQNKYLFPVVNKAWNDEKTHLINAIKAEGESVNLIGDGRCDSPGHNAKYGTYTLMTDAGKVLTFNIVQVSEVTSSNAMEKEGFERCYQELRNNDVEIYRIATDRHVSIASTMDKDHPETLHQFDVWHLAKSISKKLTKKSNLKGYEELKPWVKSVSLHLWWCSATCGGSAEVLREKWKSILNHITNKHSWNGNTHFHKCSHPDLTARQIQKKKWLKPDSLAFVALEAVVTDKRLLKDLGKLTEFCHTGELEVYHSLMLKYCPKREHFSYQGMLARTQLTALDNNAHAGRQQAIVTTGEHSGEARYKVGFQKAQKNWVVKPIKEAKSYAHVHELMGNVVNVIAQGNIEEVAQELVIPNLPRNIAKNVSFMHNKTLANI